MSTQQPEALRLADWLFDNVEHINHADAGGELRRLHAINAELVEALNEINNWLVCAAIATPEDMAQSFPYMQAMAEAAIAKAGGEA